jgi:hypothetical protein
MRSVRITSRATLTPSRPSARVEVTRQHPAASLPLVAPQAIDPRQGSPGPDPRLPTGQRRLRWSASTR